MRHFFYTNIFGRFLLKQCTRPGVSKVVGSILDRPVSRLLIRPFIQYCHLDLTDYPVRNYSCFNDFFTRRILPDRRPIDDRPTSLISPCDGLMSVRPIDENTAFSIKDSLYTVNELLQDDSLARQYHGGYCVILRLTVSHFHRYCYLDDGFKEENHFIPGILHTVQPIAHMYHKVFKTNSREYTVLHTRNFDDIIQMEVGATLVGRISNNHEAYSFVRGEEKGHFEYGGSTIVLLIKKDQVLLHHMGEEEIPVRLGEAIGHRIPF